MGVGVAGDVLRVFEKFAPTTSRMGFLELDFDETVQAFADWRRSIPQDVSVEYIDSDFPSALARLEPLTRPTHSRVLLYPCAGGRWTGYFDSRLNGSDPDPPIGHLAQELGCPGITLGYIPPAEQRGNRLGMTTFTVFGARQAQRLNVVRTLGVTEQNVGKWSYTSAGDPLPFENPEAPLARKVRDRFTPAMMLDYANHFGIHAGDAEFFDGGGRSAIVSLYRETAVVNASMSLIEARRMLGIT